MSPVDAVILVVYVLWIPAMVVTAMKERWILFAIAVIIAPVSFLSSMLEAKPGSWWVQRQKGLAAKRPSA